MTEVPSPTISMVQRTALRLLVNSLHKQITIICLKFRQISGLFTYRLGSVFKRSSPVVFHLGDLLFWAEYYRTAQDVGLLTIAVEQRRPVWINQTCTVQRQYLPQTSRSFTSQVYSTFGLDALNRDLHFMTHWLWSRLGNFTSEDDKLKAGQTREGIQKTEPSNDQKLVLL